jgi:protein-tyrosine-phosphatase/DNA-binding transcriptional ArsR family regulator
VGRDDVERRASRHAALGDPTRLSIVDDLVDSDRSPVELRRRLGIESNLLAHHLDVLEAVGFISRSRSSGDRRRRYLRLRQEALADLVPSPRLAPQPALFVCTHNSARSPLAAALWQMLTQADADSAGTHPAATIHPGAIAAGARAGVDLGSRRPRHLDEIEARPALVVTVCDRAHEELGEGGHLHWSVPDPVVHPSRRNFDDVVLELRERITTLVAS